MTTQGNQQVPAPSSAWERLVGTEQYCRCPEPDDHWTEDGTLNVVRHCRRCGGVARRNDEIGRKP